MSKFIQHDVGNNNTMRSLHQICNMSLTTTLFMLLLTLDQIYARQDQLESGYTKLVKHTGFECVEVLTTNSLEAKVKHDPKESSRTSFDDCEPITWEREELNCDRSLPPEDVCSPDGKIAEDYMTRPFDGNISCTALVAFANYRAGEGISEWDDYCARNKKNRNEETEDMD